MPRTPSPAATAQVVRTTWPTPTPGAILGPPPAPPPVPPFDPDAVHALAVRGLPLDDVCRLLGLRLDALPHADETALHDAYGRARARGAEAVAGALFERALHGDPRAQVAFLGAHAAWAATPTASPGALEESRGELIDRIRAISARIDEERENTYPNDEDPSTGAF